MKFLGTALALFALASSVSGKFFLRTVSSNHAYDGKCVYSYHTGAGTGDATLADCGPAPSKDYSFVNGRINWSGFGGDTPGGLHYHDATVNYDSWAAVTIDAWKGTNALAYNTTHGFTQKKLGNLGFIACHWAHDNALQVFSLSVKDAKIPATCEHVKLVRGCYNTDDGCHGGIF